MTTPEGADSKPRSSITGLRPAQAPVLVQSRDNPRFRSALELVQSSRERRKREQTFIEGIHLCAAFLERGLTPHQVLATEGALGHEEVSALWRQAGGEKLLLTPSLFKELSQVEQGVAIAFVIDTPRSALPERIEEAAVYLDRVQDPGNVGAILRTCAAAGVRYLLTSPASAYCWAPKVLRAAMGAHFLVEIFEDVEWPMLEPRLSVPVYSTAARAEQSIWQADLMAPCLWVFGNEGAGVSDAIGAAIARRLHIPISEQVESLNVAAAVAVTLFEQRRQQSLER